MGRDECIRILYGEVMKEIPISYAAYANSLCGWDVEPITASGKQIGVLMLKDHEIHIQLQKDQALIHMRKVIQQCAVKNLERLGYLVTRSFDDKPVIKFLERLGFYRTGQDGQVLLFRLDELKIK